MLNMHIIWISFSPKLKKIGKIYRISQNLSQIANCCHITRPKACNV